MKKTWLVIACAVALGVSGCPGGKGGQGNDPASLAGEDPAGNIRLSGGQNCTATVQPDSLEVDAGRRVVWQVENVDCSTQTVTVGRTAENGRFYAVLNCARVILEAKQTNPLRCEIAPGCGKAQAAGRRAFKYAVCANGRQVVDPEIRVGGGDSKPPCPDEPSPAEKCEDATDVTKMKMEAK